MRSRIQMSLVCLVTAFVSVGSSGSHKTEQSVPGFDANEVVRKIHARRGQADLRPGDPGRIPGRLSDRFPDPSETGGVQLSDGDEFLIDTSCALVPAPGNQTDPAVAFDGTNYLVVWQDRRSDSYSDICGTRVAPDGMVLDPSGFVVSQGAYDQRYPDVAFDGTNFLVVWDDYRRGHAFDIYGTRVTPEGTVLDGFGIIISQATNDQQCPAVAFDGAEFLVVWQDHHYNVEEPDVCGARVGSDGTVLDSAGFVISQAAHGQYNPALGFDGANFLVVWQDARDTANVHIYGSRVTPQSMVLDTEGINISGTFGTQGYPALAFDGANFCVAWGDVRGSFPPTLDIYGARVTPEGTVQRFTICSAGGAQGYPAVGHDSANFIVAWQDGRGGLGESDIYATRISPAGVVLDAGGFVVSQADGMQTYPAMGFDGVNSLVLWQDFRSNLRQPDIYGARVKPEPAVLDSEGILVTRAAREQMVPALGFDGVNYLVVWEDHRGGYSDIYGARIAPGGIVLDPSGFVVSQAEDDQWYPALGFDGENFLVVWQDYRNDPNAPDIYGARVTPAGVLLDTNGFAVTQAPDRQYAPGLGFDGVNFLVVWQDLRSGGNNFNIFGARVSPGGTVLDPSGIAISQAAGMQWCPVTASDGANFLVAWHDERGGTYSDIYGARVSPGGTVLDPAGIAISRANSSQWYPALGFDGTNFLAVWEDYRSSVWPDIYGARVTPGGVVLDTSGIAVCRGPRDQFAPVLAFEGTNYLVLWEDYRSSNNPDIYGARVSPGDSVFDEGSVVRQAGVQSGLALTRGPGPMLFLAYQGWVGTFGDKIYNTYRVWGTIDPTPGGGVEEMPNAEVRATNLATVVRGVLLLPLASGVLLDIGGRKVLDLQPGVNDVRGLAPGVYFVRSGPPAGSRQPAAVTKVLVTR